MTSFYSCRWHKLPANCVSQKLTSSSQFVMLFTSHFQHFAPLQQKIRAILRYGVLFPQFSSQYRRISAQGASNRMNHASLASQNQWESNNIDEHNFGHIWTSYLTWEYLQKTGTQRFISNSNHVVHKSQISPSIFSTLWSKHWVSTQQVALLGQYLSNT